MAARSAARGTGLLAFILLATLLLADADQPGSFAITNLMDIGGGIDISVHCHTPQTDLGPAVINTGLTYTIDFQFDPSVNVPYVCDFAWVGGSPTNSQTVPVWTHDGTAYLSVCDQCSWKVENDGFYVLSTGDNLYHVMYSWSSSNLKL